MSAEAPPAELPVEKTIESSQDIRAGLPSEMVNLVIDRIKTPTELGDVIQSGQMPKS